MIIEKNYFERLLWLFCGAQIGGGFGMAAWDKILPPIEESPAYSVPFPYGSFAMSILSDLGFVMGLRCPKSLLGVQFN